MRYRYTGLTVLCCSAFFALFALRSQPATPRQRPYVAVSKLTIYAAEPGKPEVVKDIIRRTEAGDSQGRRYTSASPNLPERFRYDWIRDVVAGRSYQVNRLQKLAYFTRLDSTDSGPSLANAEMEEVEILGIRCLKGPVREVRPDGGSEVVGTSCVSVALGNLLVHDEVRAKIGGENLRMVTVLENVQLDTEPPAEWFRIPEDFRLVAGSPGTPASQN
ncbi:MAG: hypothetical protein KIT09_18015 [Bryobacteraceae bacterium]|nr:hypothetical protein [Bryobacteraceae bacterium]